MASEKETIRMLFLNSHTHTPLAVFRMLPGAGGGEHKRKSVNVIFRSH